MSERTGSVQMHNNPSGGIFYHNTSVKTGMPLVLWTGETVSNCITRNNLFVGTEGNYAYESTAPMRRCDFDAQLPHYGPRR